jgi:hypothetical protein
MKVHLLEFGRTGILEDLRFTQWRSNVIQVYYQPTNFTSPRPLSAQHFSAMRISFLTPSAVAIHQEHWLSFLEIEPDVSVSRSIGKGY